MRDVVIVEAVRSPIGKRGGGLSAFHSADLLGLLQKEVVGRARIDAELVDQVVGGCISQVGMQAFNVTRNAWLAAGLPASAPASTVDTQCGSSQHALNLAANQIRAGVIDTAVACGVEVMSRVPMGSSLGQGVGKAIPKSYFARLEYTTQFEAAERIAKKWGVSREEADTFGLRSQNLAQQAWAEDRFSGQILDIDAPDLGEDGKPTGTTHRVTRDEGLRETTREGLASLTPVVGEDGVHTAGTSSQIADAAAAVLLMAREKAEALGLRPLARIVDTAFVGTDPVLMLTGPITATQQLLARNKMTIGDIDVFENNEAFASVVLAWARELEPDMDRVNPNGGAIAMGHALGSTGCVLLTKAVYELHRADKSTALVTMCCGGGVGTGTLIERL